MKYEFVARVPGQRQQVMTRRTAVLIKEGNEWKEVHTHSSPVVAPQ